MTRRSFALTEGGRAERLLGAMEVDDNSEESGLVEDVSNHATPIPRPFVWGAKMRELGICCVVGMVLWFIPKPEGVTWKAWHLFSIFVATITGVALMPLPLGAVALLGLGVAMLTGTLTFSEAFSAFDSEVPCVCLLHLSVLAPFTEVSRIPRFHEVERFPY